jgi:hypothetical protein
MVMINDVEFSADPEERIARAEKRLCSLQRSASVADIFIRIAERKALALEAGGEPEAGPDALDIFVKSSRILHESVALQPRVEKKLAALRAGDPLVETTSRRASYGPCSGDFQNPQAKPEPDRMLRRDQLHGFVLDLANPMSFEPVERERVYEQIHQRMYESERYDLLLDLSTEDAVEAICKDLGVRPQYERWEGLGWPPWRQNRPPAALPDAGDRPSLDALEPVDDIPPHPPP